MQRPSEELPAWLISGVADRVLTSAPTPMAVLNMELRHVLVNHALGKLYGIDPRTATGSTPVQLLGHLGGQVEDRCRAVIGTQRAEVGHVVTGVLSTAPDAEVTWQVDCMPITNADEVPAALLLIVTDITARTRAMRSLNEQRRALAYQASHDPVTGLANRFQLLEVLQYHLSGQSFPNVLMVDLDGFKQVNDVHGHAAGDHVLSTIADRLRSCVRTEDLVARYGGDEFVLVIRQGVDAQAFAERLVDLIGEPIPWAGKHLSVGASIGVAEAGPGDSVSGLLHRADEHMYEVKVSTRRRSDQAV